MTQEIIDKFHLVPGKLEHPDLENATPYEWPGLVEGYNCYLIAEGKSVPTTLYRLWFRNIALESISYRDVEADVLTKESLEKATQLIRDLILG
jgi:hypothetical protein